MCECGVCVCVCVCVCMHVCTCVCVVCVWVIVTCGLLHGQIKVLLHATFANYATAVQSFCKLLVQ